MAYGVLLRLGLTEQSILAAVGAGKVNCLGDHHDAATALAYGGGWMRMGFGRTWCGD